MFPNCCRQNLLSYTSDHVKTAMGQYYLRGQEIDIRRHREAEEYQTQMELSLAHMRNIISLTEQCATVRRHHESQLLLDLMHAPDKDPDQSAVHIARSARDTLVAEEEVVMSRLREAQLTVSKLQNAVEIARLQIRDANYQLCCLLDHLHINKKSIPSIQHTPQINGVPCPIPSRILAPQYHMDIYLPTECFLGKNLSTQWAGQPLSGRLEQDWRTSENSTGDSRSVTKCSM